MLLTGFQARQAFSRTPSLLTPRASMPMSQTTSAIAYCNCPDTGPSSITVDLSGKFAYVADEGGHISLYTIGTDGSLTPVTTAAVPADTTPKSIITTGIYQ